MNEIFDFSDEQLEFIIDRITHNEPSKNVDRKALFDKIDENMKKFIKNNNPKTFKKFRENLNENQQKVFYFIVHSSSIKIPNEFYDEISNDL